MKNLKKIREKAGKTQEDISKLFNIDRSAVAKWESGVSFPRTDRLSQLAKVLNCTVDDLIGNSKESSELLGKEKITVLPFPKVLNKGNNLFVIPDKLKVCIKSDMARMAFEIMRELLKEIDVSLEETHSDKNSHVTFEKISTGCKEYYRLVVSPDKITVRFSDRMGARNAVMTIYNLISHYKDRYSIPGCSVIDWPHSEFRGIMLDMARKYIPLEQVYSSIKQMALAKMNVLMIHISDTDGFAFQSDLYPAINNCKVKQYAKEEMRSIIECCKFWGIETIPAIDFPAHANTLYKYLPDVRCKIDDGSVDSDWAVCVGTDYTYKLIEDLFTEAFEMFDSKYACTWGDELEFLDLSFVDCWLNWDSCSVCRSVMESEGYKDKQELYYRFIRKVNDILKKMGKTLMVGNDSIDINANPDIPKDIIIVWWRVAGEKRGFHLGQDMEKFIKAGFKVININYPDTYIDLYLNEERLSTFNPVKRPEISEELQGQVLGSYLCAWDDKNHFRWTLPSGITMFSDKLWSHFDREYNKDYKVALTRTLLGPKTPDGFDIFTGLGGCILPQDMNSERMGYPDKLTVNDIPYIDYCIDVLEMMIDEGTVNSDLCGVYIDCLNWVKDNIK